MLTIKYHIVFRKFASMDLNIVNSIDMNIQHTFPFGVYEIEVVIRNNVKKYFQYGGNYIQFNHDEQIATVVIRDYDAEILKTNIRKWRIDNL